MSTPVCIDSRVHGGNGLAVPPPKEWYNANPMAKRRRPYATAEDVREHARNKSEYTEAIAAYLAQTAASLAAPASLKSAGALKSGVALKYGGGGGAATGGRDPLVLFLALVGQTGAVLHQVASIPALRPEVDLLLSILDLQPLQPLLPLQPPQPLRETTGGTAPASEEQLAHVGRNSSAEDSSSHQHKRSEALSLAMRCAYLYDIDAANTKLDCPADTGISKSSNRGRCT